MTGADAVAAWGGRRDWALAEVTKIGNIVVAAVEGRLLAVGVEVGQGKMVFEIVGSGARSGDAKAAQRRAAKQKQVRQWRRGRRRKRRTE